MKEREDKGGVDDKLPSPAKGLTGMTTRLWVEDWICASPAVAFFALWLGLGMSDESE